MTPISLPDFCSNNRHKLESVAYRQQLVGRLAGRAQLARTVLRVRRIERMVQRCEDGSKFKRAFELALLKVAIGSVVSLEDEPVVSRELIVIGVIPQFVLNPEDHAVQ